MRNALALLTPEGLEGVVATVIDNNPGMDESTAERIVAEAIKFVHTAAQFSTASIAPSKVVDEGWHALILHTELYAKLCEALGCFVHHYPERPDPGRFDQHALTRTVATIEQAGYETDPELWTGPARSLVSVAARCNHTPCGPIRPGNCATHGGGDD
ncbi:hypothetical protein GTY40_08605 [Streptomyces sp. SID8359]|uniref:glycine-rich domain-containing protein n=1 Tax=unclassified Streptomyces TaxID=2593676 RepID=UPI000516A0E6|nr:MULTISPECIES: hypothetical protein [unclassified Streptomyces]MYT91103.1 hypothetical protein [Streptomyces sp. SID8359]